MLPVLSLSEKAKPPGHESVYVVTGPRSHATEKSFADDCASLGADGFLILSWMASPPACFASSLSGLAYGDVSERTSCDIPRGQFSTRGSRSSNAHRTYGEAPCVDGCGCPSDFIWDRPTDPERASELVYPQLVLHNQVQNLTGKSFR